MTEADEIVVSYLVICDQVITEAGSGKQSLIGIYSALITDQIPMVANIAIAISIRVQSARLRELTVRFSGPDGAIIFSSPALPCDWNSVPAGLRASGFATLQIGVNLRALPFQLEGVYTVTLYSDGVLLATYPISVVKAASQPKS